MSVMPAFGRESRVNVLLGTGHFLSHFYVLCLPLMFLSWQKTFGVSFAELGLAITLMSGATGLLQTPVGFLVDRHGARPFLVGGTLLMTLSMAAMSFATAYWQILALALLSGIGNSVIHPADYSVLAGSISRHRMGRAFALHTFNGNVGSVCAPPVTAALVLLIGWRETLMVYGLVGVPLVLTILWQSGILREHARDVEVRRRPALSGGAFLLTRPILLFFGFFLLSAMATSGLQAWLITVLHEVRGLDLKAASTALTAYMAGATGGILIGGWVADRNARLLAFAVTATIAASALLLVVGTVSMTQFATVAVLFVAGILTGASRTPRDLMVKDASPPGQIGKVFGFVSAGLPLGNALTPVPFGFLIDAGRADLVLVLVAAILMASLMFMGSARASTRHEAVPVAAE
ncbi:MAG TPA: MFS transporter [Xanthobacteraceae bacterium]|nr:MFS transporter [Xanthobacteraceae bacterium]